MPLFDYHPRTNEPHDKDTERKIFKYSLLFSVLIVGSFWVVKAIEDYLGKDLTEYGILPLQLDGLKGIIFSPFVHGSYDHLISNSVPFLVLSFALFYFYRNLAYRILVLIYLLSGLCVWLGGRDAYHVGASGIIYGLASFLFFSGVFRKDANLLTISIIVVFLYGSMFWGIFPLKPGISWESHFWGWVSGLALAWYYRRQGPVRPVSSWENEPEEDEEDETVDENLTGSEEENNQNLPLN